MNYPPKASSVSAEGQPDGFVPPTAWRAEVERDGRTRLVISAPAEAMPAIYAEIVAVVEGPLSVMYLQLTDRRAGKHHPGKPRRFIGVDRPVAKVRAALERCRDFIHFDARHQLWLRGKFGEQVVVDELGLVYIYPDDPMFRDKLTAMGIPEIPGFRGMAERDYVRVEMQAALDPQEEILLRELSLQEAHDP